MVKSDYSESVTHALRRVQYLLDGTRHVIAEEHDELAALQSHFIQELRKIRHQLWEYRHDTHISHAMHQLERAEIAIRGRVFEDAFLNLNSAYAFLSRLALRSENLTEQVDTIASETYSMGMSSGLMIGFLLGISIFILTTILSLIGY
ncbi:hypothetical protein ACFLQI_02625 [Candidatus Undinarchaeota archaeon]